MLKLEDINKGAQIRGIEPEEIVRVVTVEPVGECVRTSMAMAVRNSSC